MAVVVVDQSGNGDFTSLQAAIDASPATLTEPYEVQLEPGNYAGDIVIPARSGESFTNYIKITHTPGNRATDFGGGTGPHILGNGGGHATTVNGNFVWYQGVAVTLDSTNGTSDEAFRINGTELLFQSCYIESPNDVRSQDCFYFGQQNINQRAKAVNCVIKGFSRAAFHSQFFDINAATEHVWESYYNTVIDCGRSGFQTGNTGASDAGGFSLKALLTNGSSVPPQDAIVEVVCYNTIVANTFGYLVNNLTGAPDPAPGSYRDTSLPSGGRTVGTVVWTGGGNVSHQDNYAEDKFGAVNSYGNVSLPTVEPTSGQNVYFSDIANSDYSIAGENNFTVTQLGIAVPTPSDPRIDLSVDILGNDRPAIGTIGAFQFGGGGVELETNNTLLSSTTDSIVLVQSNVLGTQAVTSNTIVHEPVLFQESVISPNDIEISSVVDGSDLLQSLALVLDQLRISVSSETTEFNQASSIDVADSAMEPSIDNIDVSENAFLEPQSSTNSTLVDGVGVSESSVIDPQGLELTTLAEATTLLVEGVLEVQRVSENTSVDAASMTQANVLNAIAQSISTRTDLAQFLQNAVVDVFSMQVQSGILMSDLIQANVLNVLEQTLSTAIEFLELNQANLLDLQPTLQSVRLDEAILTNSTILVAADQSLETTIAQINLTSANVLVVESLLSAIGLDSLNLTQSSSIGIDSLSIADAVDLVTISNAQVIDVNGARTITESQSVSLTQAQVIDVSVLQTQPGIDPVFLSQGFVLPVFGAQTQTVLASLVLSNSDRLQVNNLLEQIALQQPELLESTTIVVNSTLFNTLTSTLSVFSGEITTPSSRVHLVKRDDRVVIVVPDPPSH